MLFSRQIRRIDSALHGCYQVGWKECGPLLQSSNCQYKAQTVRHFLCNNVLKLTSTINRFLEAERDSNLAIKFDPKFGKAYFRRGLARKELKRFKSALEDFQMADKFSPNNDEISKEREWIRNCLKSGQIRIHSIEKSKQFRSTMPMKKIPIESDFPDNKTSEDKLDIVDVIKELVEKHKNPKSYIEFESALRELSSLPSNQMSEKVKYLEQIDLKSMEKIFTYPFDSQGLYQVLLILSHSKKYTFIFKVLKIITKMPRFYLNVNFFGEDEHQGMCRFYRYIK